MRLRQTPRLRFHEDSSIKDGFEMTQKLDALARSDAQAEAGNGG
jgi:ribosome-binding factor A